uniref:LMBR1 domain containing 1 n=1 Tax=Homo sapiens TaxID=9606 RepID=A0A3B3IS99_HUMAN
MKNQNGTFKDWANANVSRQIEDTVLYGYYILGYMCRMYRFVT